MSTDEAWEVSRHTCPFWLHKLVMICMAAMTWKGILYDFAKLGELIAGVPVVECFCSR